MDSTGDESTPLPDRFRAASLDMLRRSDQALTIPIQGRSMLPLIQEGDQLRVIPGTAGIRRGDVILFLQGTQLFAHRVLSQPDRSGQPGFLTKGDNVLLPDPLVPLDQVIGRVSMIQRGNRQLSLETSAWRRLGYLTALLMLAWSWLLARARRLKSRLGFSASHWLTARLISLARNSLQRLLRTCQMLFSHWRNV